MLTKIMDVGELEENQRFGVSLINGWIALCPITGAFLTRTHGRNRRGDTKYTLVFPNKTPQERGGLLAPYEWDYPSGRKFIRAWNDGEAIDIANKKLDRMISQ